MQICVQIACMLKAKLYLDTRRSLKDGRYPLKLHVFENSDIRTYYATGEKLTETEWLEVKSHSTRSRELKTVLARIVQYQAKALTIIESDKHLSLQQFDALFSGRITRSSQVKAFYEEKIKDLIDEGNTVPT